MKSYVAFLRAINVGGHVVKMDKLRGLFEELEFNNVRTYIQSGNVFFETTESSRQKLSKKIESHLQKSLGYKVTTFLRTTGELEAIFKLDPFKGVKVTPSVRLYVVFLAKPLPSDARFPIESPNGAFTILSATSGEAFMVLKLINGRPGNTSAFIEKTFGIPATSRFYHTTQKILEAVKK
jgi:uncharacterized protein (DUF1697 family)